MAPVSYAPTASLCGHVATPHHCAASGRETRQNASKALILRNYEMACGYAAKFPGSAHCTPCDGSLNPDSSA